MCGEANGDMEKGEEGFMGDVRPERDVVSEMMSKSESMPSSSNGFCVVNCPMSQ